MSDKNKLRKYVGNFEFYYETGMEQIACIFHDDRGLHQGPIWNKPGETMTYRSLSWSVWLSHGLGQYKTRVFDKEDSLVYEGPLTQDKKKIVASKYSYSFLPKEMSKKEWLKICKNEYRAELYTNEITLAEKELYKVEYDIGTQVVDDLTGKDAIVVNITIDEHKNVGYWVNSDYLQGGRMSWELTAIDWAERIRSQNE